MTAIDVLLLLTVFLIPIVRGSGNFGFEISKVLTFYSLVSIGGIIWLLKKPKFRWDGISLAANFFVLILLLTSMLGIDPKISLLGQDPYFQGLILYGYLFLFFLLAKTSSLKLENWALSLSLSAILVSVLAIKDWVLLNLGQFAPTYADRVVVTFGQPNFYAGFLLMSIPFEAYLIKRYQKLAILGLVLSGVAIFISQSRIAILMMFGLLIIWYLKNLHFKKSLLYLSVLALTLVVLFQASFGLFTKELADPFKNQWLIDNSPEKRVLLMPVFLNLVKERFVFGYGLENIRTAFSDYFAKLDWNRVTNPTYYSLKDIYVDSSHNYILDLWLFSGILGLLGWFGILIALFKKFGQIYNDRDKFVLMTELILYLIWIQFQNQSLVHLIYFWLILSLTGKGTKYSN